MKGITWAELIRGAITVSADTRPEPPPNSILYRCGSSWYLHKSEWRNQCLKTKAPHARCACNQNPQESEVAA